VEAARQVGSRFGLRNVDREVVRRGDDLDGSEERRQLALVVHPGSRCATKDELDAIAT
jgi:hypothetical protein